MCYMCNQEKKILKYTPVNMQLQNRIDQDLFRNAAPTYFPLLQVGGGGEDLRELQFESEETGGYETDTK